MATLLSAADQALGRLDGSTGLLPNPDLFIFMYVRKEAVLSSQIEGTQASLMDVLEFEGQAVELGQPKDVGEVVNYVAAMNLGIERLNTLPVSLRLIREIHAQLMRGVRGAERTPGEFRRSQNWVGPPNTPITVALYVPPPPQEMKVSLHDFEKFLHAAAPMPALIKVGLAHAQFETIHPFLDGNGRVGRLLITFLLYERKVLRQPLLYLSTYLKEHRDEYYARLQAVRDQGDWEGWLKFFLRGIREVSQEAVQTAHRIVRMREEHRSQLLQMTGRTGPALTLLESLYWQPVVGVTHVIERTGLAFPNANNLVNRFVELGLLREITGRKRDRRFAYQPYLDLFA
ncbi:MAG: Fic family protein [Acidobacteriota bacterium]